MTNFILWLFLMGFILLLVLTWTISPLLSIFLFVGAVIWLNIQESLEEES